MCDQNQRIVIIIIGTCLLISLVAGIVGMFQKVEMPPMFRDVVGGCLIGLAAFYQHKPQGTGSVGGDVAGDVTIEQTPKKEEGKA